MINRELTKREREILEMIRPTTFQDIVDDVRRDVEHSRYEAKRALRNLYNGNMDRITNDITKGIINTANGKNEINNIIEETCEVSI